MSFNPDETEINEIGYTDLVLYGRSYKILGYPRVAREIPKSKRTKMIPNKKQILIVQDSSAFEVGTKSYSPDPIPFAYKIESSRSKNNGALLAPISFDPEVVQYLVDLEGNKIQLL